MNKINVDVYIRLIDNKYSLPLCFKNGTEFLLYPTVHYAP